MLFYVIELNLKYVLVVVLHGYWVVLSNYDKKPPSHHWIPICLFYLQMY